MGSAGQLTAAAGGGSEDEYVALVRTVITRRLCMKLGFAVSEVRMGEAGHHHTVEIERNRRPSLDAEFSQRN